MCSHPPHLTPFVLILSSALGVAGCGSEAEPERPAEFELRFAPLVDGKRDVLELEHRLPSLRLQL